MDSGMPPVAQETKAGGAPALVDTQPEPIGETATRCCQQRGERHPVLCSVLGHMSSRSFLKMNRKLHKLSERSHTRPS